MPQYIQLRGHETYCYEWDNDGEAVVLLHGGLSKTSSWDYIMVPPLEDDFHIFAYDRTSHGSLEIKSAVCTLNFKLVRRLHI